jgi:hypothetical protein
MMDRHKNTMTPPVEKIIAGEPEEKSGAERNRTAGLIRARDALSQLSYCPTFGTQYSKRLSERLETVSQDLLARSMITPSSPQRAEDRPTDLDLPQSTNI